MTDALKQELLALARRSIASRFDHSPVENPRNPEFQPQRGVFVSLHKDGDLRGCIGYIKGYKSIADSVIEMARQAAFHDPRFRPLREQELPGLNIEISILSELLPVTDSSALRIGRDGLYIQHPHGSGLLLPQVPVEWHWDLPTFLKQLCRKAGLPDGAWKDEAAQLFRFEAEVFSESDFLP